MTGLAKNGCHKEYCYFRHTPAKKGTALVAAKPKTEPKPKADPKATPAAGAAPGKKKLQAAKKAASKAAALVATIEEQRAAGQ